MFGLGLALPFMVVRPPIRRRKRDHGCQRLLACAFSPVTNALRNSYDVPWLKTKHVVAKLVIAFSRHDVEQLLAVWMRMKWISVPRSNRYDPECLLRSGSFGLAN
ncbi:hypothetical protein V1280_008606 [Bradyrhizobium sp. AZCC 2230]